MSKHNTAIQKQESRVQVPERIDEGVYYTPLVDIIETPDAFMFQADLPGVKAEDLDISIENNALTIDGRVRRRQPESQQYIWREFGVGHFHRSFHLNTPVDAAGIRAELKNGELMLTVPKAESAKARKVPIKSS